MSIKLTRTIASNYPEYVKSIAKDILTEPENFMGKDNPTKEEVLAYARELATNEYPLDELINFNIPLEGRVIAIVDAGRWNGRVTGYKILGKNFKDLLSYVYGSGEYFKVGLANKNIKAEVKHHDGTNRYEFREIREDRNIENLTQDLYEGKEISRSKINYYTKSLGGYVKKVYG